MYIGYCESCHKSNAIIVWSKSVITSPGYDWEDSIEYSECLKCHLKSTLRKITFPKLRYKLFNRGGLKLAFNIMIGKYGERTSISQRIAYARMFLK